MRTTRSKPQPQVSLRSIAEELNVSVSLVSKVLSGRLGTTGANSRKIDAIRRKAQELNYRKNVLASSLRSGRQSVLGVCIHRHGAPGSAIVDEMVFGITDEANRHQQRLTIHYFETADEFRMLAQGLHRNAIDGLIMGGIYHSELAGDLRELEQGGVPVISIYDAQRKPAFVNVGMDQFDLAKRATHHLIDQGCRRIAHFDVSDSLELLNDRNRGCRAATLERELDYHDELTLSVPDYSYEQAVVAMRKLLATGARFDGVSAQSDQQAAASLNLLIAAGLKVPQQVKIIGVDNSPFCLYASVPLSSVSQEFTVRGRTAVQMLLNKLNGKEVASLNIDPVIHVRASSSLTRKIV